MLFETGKEYKIHELSFEEDFLFIFQNAIIFK